VAAYAGGWVDRLIMRFMDVLLAFPIILLAIAVLAVLGPGSVNTGPGDRHRLHADLRTPRARSGADRALVGLRGRRPRPGRTPRRRIILRHVLPNIAAPLLVQITLSLSTAILVEASLSFLGLGTQPPTPSLGLMLSDSRDYLLLSPWTSVFSGLAILLASFGFNLFGDGLRDLLDPALRNAAA
jgi:peptide/nickel transport system permease protein